MSDSRYQIYTDTSERSGLPIYLVEDTVAGVVWDSPLWVNFDSACTGIAQIRDDLEGPDPDNPRTV